MINIRLFSLTVLFCLASSATLGEQEIGLKGANLGMTLSEFREFPYASELSDNYSEARVYCSGDDVDEVPHISERLKHYEGLIRCFHFAYFNMPGGDDYATDTPVSYASLGSLNVKNVGYYFYQDGESEPRLALIESQFVAELFDYVYVAIAGKYGDPDNATETPVQNRFGAQFTNIEATWIFGHKEIEIIQYDGTLELGLMRIRDLKLINAWRDEREKARSNEVDF